MNNISVTKKKATVYGIHEIFIDNAWIVDKTKSIYRADIKYPERWINITTSENNIKHFKNSYASVEINETGDVLIITYPNNTRYVEILVFL